MKAFEIQNEFGIEALKLVERPQPQPGFKQVLVRVRAASLNYRDLLVVKGQYDPRLSRPRVPLSDGVGEVAAVGEQVSRVQMGDRVAGIFMQKWLGGEVTPESAKSALGGAVDGMLAEYVLLHEDGLVHVPAHLSDEEAAALPCAAVTAWHALVVKGRLRAGETVLVQGTGGVSIFALQFARMMGARVIATSGDDAKLERVLRLGAAEGVNYRQTPEWGRRVRELTGGRGVDQVVEVGGAGTLNESLAAVRMGGTVSMIGVLTGGSAEINTTAILMKSVRVHGIYVGSREMFEAMNQALAVNELRPVIDRVFPFDEAPAALKYMESGAHFGKICLSF